MRRADVLGLYTQSLGTSGYQKLPSGFTIQWGQVTPAASGTATVTFPVAFATACVLAIGTAYQTQISGQLATVSTQSMSTTGCSLAARTQAGLTGGNGTFPVLWFALGY